MFRKSSAFGKLSRQVVLPAGILSILLAPGAAAADESPAPQKPAEAETQIELAGDKDMVLKIDEINDLGYALQRIRQQAINIYVEAIRKRNSPEVSVELPCPTRVPADLPADTANLLPFRRPWLVYFITTLEPLVHLLKHDISDLKSGTRRLNVTPETRKALDPLLDEWSLGVTRINEELATATALIEDADKHNIELARIAGNLDKEVTKLESLRDKCFTIVDEMEQKWKKYGASNGGSGAKVR